MASHREQTAATSLSESVNHPEIALSISSNQFSGWRRVLTSLSPFVARSSGANRTLSEYARGLINENVTQSENAANTQPINIPNVDERHHRRSNILGIWSSSPNVHLGRRMNISNTEEHQNSNFISVPLQRDENVVISIEADPLQESHMRPSTPINRTNDVTLHVMPPQDEINEFESGTSATNAPSSSENAIGENAQPAEHGPELSIYEILERHPELRSVLKLAVQYFIFLLIVMIKVIYDRFASLFTVVLFFFGFTLSNKVVKRAVTHNDRRSFKLTVSLLLILVLIPLGVYLFYHMASTNLYYSAMLLPSETSFLSLGELLWIVIITDFVLKLFSVFIKGLYSLLPSMLLHYKNRGKHLAMIEVTSQLYRSLAPIQPWISYLFDSYTGIQKLFGIFLSAMYMLCKGPDLIYKVKTLVRVFQKFLQSSTYGSAPSKAQLKDTGSLCPICQDDFVIPTMLQCKHIFCEQCVAKWFDRERTCPMCRTKVADDPSYRDGGTSHSVQLF